MNFVKLAKLNTGDKVAILSPSGDAASYFPWVVDKGIERLKIDFGLTPVEFPSTRKRLPSAKERAQDLMAAFAQKDIKAIIATLGGSDQIKILPYLDPSIFTANPKPFMGFSDNSNFIQYLWRLGIPAYYGGALMTQFAMAHKMEVQTVASVRHALFEEGSQNIAASQEFTDIGLDWAVKSNLAKSRFFEANDGWHWDGSGAAKGLLWGGCAESLMQYLSAGQPLPDFDDTNIILFLETAENIPPHWIVEVLITSLGERKVLQNVSGVLVGRPKTWDFDKQLSPEERVTYRIEQRETIVKAIREYRQNIPIVQNIDFGHTDPQIIVPSGNLASIDTAQRTISFSY